MKTPLSSKEVRITALIAYLDLASSTGIEEVNTKEDNSNIY